MSAKLAENMRKSVVAVVAIVIATACSFGTVPKASSQGLPSVPLLVHDPYLSVWLPYVSPTMGAPQHWSGKELPLALRADVDGTTYRLLGTPVIGERAARVAASEGTATTTRYRFEAGSVVLDLEFVSPKDVQDLDSLALPGALLYVTVESRDGAEHGVDLRLDVGPEFAPAASAEGALLAPFVMNTEAGAVTGLLLRPRLAEPFSEAHEWPLWGDHVVLALPGLEAPDAAAFLTSGEAAQNVQTLNEVRGMPATPGESGRLQWAATIDSETRARFTIAFLRLTRNEAIRMDRYMLRFTVLPPWWLTRFPSEQELIAYLVREQERLAAQAQAVDDRIDRLGAAISEEYAHLLRAAYRQVLGSFTLVSDPQDGAPLLVNKEISSGGFTNTVDVLYPTMPFFLVLNPELLKPQLAAVFRSVETWPWTQAYAPHDLGHYPHMNGQAYGAPMPVEESANMLLMTAAYLRFTGDVAFVRKYWNWLLQWKAYLIDYGLDPAEQLFTDDFTGPVAHNAHLALKAVVGVGAFAQMAEALGEEQVAWEAWRDFEHMAASWQERAWAGDHIVRVYDDRASWSIPYNLMMAYLLDLDVLPQDKWETEFAFLMRRRGRFGIPLEDRFGYTKSDWLLWIAAIAPTEEARDVIIRDVVTMLERTPDRVPFTDWYETSNARHLGFRARPVVGGVYAPLLFVDMEGR